MQHEVADSIHAHARLAIVLRSSTTSINHKGNQNAIVGEHLQCDHIQGLSHIDIPACSKAWPKPVRIRWKMA